jgi:AcrR family transcriptional regulator
MTDREILALAARLWEQSNGADFTMDRLSETTGVSRATLYRRFGSREAILQRLVDDHAIDIEELSQPDIPTRIVQATGEALNRAGFAGITIEKIAQAAGVGPATVYRHFGSKDALIEAFIAANSPRQLLRSLVANASSNLEADLILVATALLEFLRDNPSLVRLFAFEEQASRDYLAEIRATQGRTINMLADYLAGHIKLGNLQPSDPFALALAFTGMLLGLGLVGPQSYHRPIYEPAEVARFATRIFLSGMTQPQLQKVENER